MPMGWKCVRKADAIASEDKSGWKIQKGGKDYMTIISLLIIDGLNALQKGAVSCGLQICSIF